MHSQSHEGKPSPHVHSDFLDSFQSATPLELSQHEFYVGGISAIMGYLFGREYLNRWIGANIESVTGQWTTVASALIFGWAAAISTRYLQWDQRILNLFLTNGSK